MASGSIKSFRGLPTQKNGGHKKPCPPYKIPFLMLIRISLRHNLVLFHNSEIVVSAAVLNVRYAHVSLHRNLVLLLHNKTKLSR